MGGWHHCRSGFGLGGLVALSCFYVHSPCYKSTSFVPGPSLPLSPAAGECLPVLPSLFSCQTSTPKMHVHFFRGASINLTWSQICYRVEAGQGVSVCGMYNKSSCCSYGPHSQSVTAQLEKRRFPLNPDLRHPQLQLLRTVRLDKVLSRAMSTLHGPHCVSPGPWHRGQACSSAHRKTWRWFHVWNGWVWQRENIFPYFWLLTILKSRPPFIFCFKGMERCKIKMEPWWLRWNKSYPCPFRLSLDPRHCFVWQVSYIQNTLYVFRRKHSRFC